MTLGWTESLTAVSVDGSGLRGKFDNEALDALSFLDFTENLL